MTADLVGKAGAEFKPSNDRLEQARLAWEKSMMRRVDELRTALRAKRPESLAADSGANFNGHRFSLSYWQDQLSITWPDLEAYDAQGDACPVFDTAMLLYYLSTADGSPLADHWISFRELPGGSFYVQAFQGYSGDRIARIFGQDDQAFHAAGRSLVGIRLPALSDHAYAFTPLPRVRLAAVLWLGDEEFPSSASVLFEAHSHHYMTTDGLALLGSGLASRLERAAQSQP